MTCDVGTAQTSALNLLNMRLRADTVLKATLVD